MVLDQQRAYGKLQRRRKEKKEKLEWRRKPQKPEPPVRKPLFNFSFRMSEIVADINTPRLRGECCPHVRDSFNNYVAVIDLDSGKMTNTTCPRCDLFRCRADSCPPLSLPPLPRHQELQSRLRDELSEREKAQESFLTGVGETPRSNRPRLQRMRSKSVPFIHYNEFQFGGAALPSIEDAKNR